MSSSEVTVSYGNKSHFIQLQDYKLLQELKDSLVRKYNLIKIRLYYIEKEAEVNIETEEEYNYMIKKGDVKQLFIEEYKKEKMNLDYFMSQLFVNNICCENDQYGCAICQEKKQVKPEELNQLVYECLLELLNKEDFQAFCKKQFKMNVENVDLFLEKFSKLSKPIKQILTVQPSQQFPNNFINQISQVSRIQPSQVSRIQPSQVIQKQYPMNKSTNIQQQSEFQQQPSQFLHSNIQSSLIIPEYGVKYEKKKNNYEFPLDTNAKIEVMIQNVGSKTWPSNVYIKQVGHYPSNFQYVPSLNPQERRSVSLSFQTPLNSGDYSYTWVLFYKDDSNEEKKIGSKCTTEFKVKDLPAIQKINKCVDLMLLKMFQNKSRKDIRVQVENIVHKNQELGIQQIINLAQDELNKQ
ncbi:unnamed protein product [Paramecium sonneborni]|uniref:Next to BRCA1 central domain-containing protein n=1 Tax=Paramecium sonneborni TaxID=65129 RepID=A0A8S1QTR9_9CILI|nr:unnamed protein product [Paramecium sonneborni]